MQVQILASLGFQVFAGVRQPEDGERLRRVARGVTPVLLDITHSASIRNAAETVPRALGDHGLAGLVNLAGLIVEGPLELVPMDDLRHQYEVNVIGQLAVTQAFLPLLRRGKGRVINVGAVSGRVAIPFLGPIRDHSCAPLPPRSNPRPYPAEPVWPFAAGRSVGSDSLISNRSDSPTVSLQRKVLR